MSFPNIPNITPLISVTTEQTVPLLLASIALEELALAHIMNAEAEKLQFVLGTLGDTGVAFSPAEVSIGDLLDVNTSVRRTLRDVIKKEMLLEFKFDNIMDLIAVTGGGAPFACECGIATGGIVDIPGILVTIPIINPIPFQADATLNVNICPNCQANGSFFNLTLSAGLNSAILNIDATNITSVTCVSGVVTIMGTGTLNLNGVPITVDFKIVLDDNASTVSVTLTAPVTGVTILSATIPVGLTLTTC